MLVCLRVRRVTCTELSIFSDHFHTEIDSYDVETGRCDKFGEGKYENRCVLSSSAHLPYSVVINRCVLLYSGIHYDAVSLAPTRDAPLDFHTTVFPIEGSDHVSQAAAKLASQLRASRKFTNTSNFDLKCEVSKIISFKRRDISSIWFRFADKASREKRRPEPTLQRQDTLHLGSTNGAC